MPPPGLEDDLQGTRRHTGHQQQVPAAPGPSRTQPEYELGPHQRQRPSSGAKPSAGPSRQPAQSTSGGAQRPTPQQSAPHLPGSTSFAAAQQAGQPLPQQGATPGSTPRPGRPLSFFDQVMAGAPNAANSSAAAVQQAALHSGGNPGHVPASGEPARLEQAQLPQGLQQVMVGTSHADADATAGRQAHPESGRSPGHVPSSEDQPGMAARSQGQLSGCLWGHSRDPWSVLEAQRDPVMLQVVGLLAHRHFATSPGISTGLTVSLTELATRGGGRTCAT